MALLLQIFGAIFLLLIVVIAGCFAYCILGGESVPDFDLDEEVEKLPRVDLTAGELTPAHPERMTALREAFLNAGAAPVGNYVAQSVDATLVTGFRFDDPCAFAVVYDHPDHGVWADVMMLLETGGTYTLSSAPELVRGAPRPDEHIIAYLDASDNVIRMLAVAQEYALMSPAKDLKDVDFLDAYHGVSHHCHEHLKTGTVTAPWVKKFAASRGVELDDDEVEYICSIRNDPDDDDDSDQSHEIEADCLLAYARMTGLDAGDWEEQRPHIIVVFDELDVWRIEAVYDDIHEEYGENLHEILCDDAATGLRERIAQFNASLPPEHALIKKAELESPVLADIYLAPDTVRRRSRRYVIK